MFFNMKYFIHEKKYVYIADFIHEKKYVYIEELLSIAFKSLTNKELSLRYKHNMKP